MKVDEDTSLTYNHHDIWMLTHLKEKDLLTGNSKEKKLPELEFYAGVGKVLGNTRSNYFIFGFKEIQFGEVSMTKKMCKNSEIENLLTKSVFGRRMKFLKESLKLKITGYDCTELIFKKID